MLKVINTKTSKSSRQKVRYDKIEIYENSNDNEHNYDDKKNNFKPLTTAAVQWSYHRTRMSQRFIFEIESRKENVFDV